jgi:hypothetical protein
MAFTESNAWGVWTVSHLRQVVEVIEKGVEIHLLSAEKILGVDLFDYLEVEGDLAVHVP